MMSSFLKQLTCRLCSAPLRRFSTSRNRHVITSSAVCDKADEPIDPDTGVEDFPSDLDEEFREKQMLRDQTKNAFRPAVDPALTSVILFPGQGAQFVGMGKKLLKNREAMNIFAEASEILNYDLLKLCLEGPIESLNRTEICQLATLVTSLAGLELLREQHPEAMDTCVATAGFSVGEYAALVFAGSLAFEDAVMLVKARAKAMQTASDEVPSGLMTVFLSRESNLNQAMLYAREYCKQKLDMKDPVCSIANYLFVETKVIGGNMEALEFIQANSKELKIRRTKQLPVSGAFHTRLMKSASKEYFNTLQKIKFRRPIIPVHSNLDNQIYNNPMRNRRILAEHMWKPVKWEQIMHALYQRKVGMGFPQTYEVGPGNQLGVILKMINRKAHESYVHIEV